MEDNVDLFVLCSVTSTNVQSDLQICRTYSVNIMELLIWFHFLVCYLCKAKNILNRNSAGRDKVTYPTGSGVGSGSLFWMFCFSVAVGAMRSWAGLVCKALIPRGGWIPRPTTRNVRGQKFALIVIERHHLKKLFISLDFLNQSKNAVFELIC